MIRAFIQFLKYTLNYNDVVECSAVDQAVMRLNHDAGAGPLGLPAFTQDAPLTMNLLG